MDSVQVEQVVGIADEAARAILAVVAQREQRNIDIDTKADGSYVTEADMAANAVICRELPKISTFPIVSEEGTAAASGTKKRRHDAVDESHYWLVDPLDGTKEFVNGSSEYTVNIALVETSSGSPVFGVVVVPVTGEAFWGGSRMGFSLRRSGWTGDAPGRIHSVPLPGKSSEERLRIATSRSHGGDQATLEACVRKATGKMDETADDWDHITAGSSLKLLWVADGRVHLYPRLGPTCWWDTAAAHAVVIGAGGDVFAFDESAISWKPLLYPNGFQRTERLLNPWFVVMTR